jgi:polyvinyl alcohol dehydrogenase (cytochrome)
MKRLVLSIATALMATCGAAIPAHAGDDEGKGLWLSAGQSTSNARFQSEEERISPRNVARLGPKWVFTTAGEVSATPAVDAKRVYVPDWKGNLYAVDRKTGAQIWSTKIADATGVPNDFARATPAVSGNRIVVGTQGQFGGGGNLLAYDAGTGALVWKTKLDNDPFAIVTQSATVSDGVVYIGVASNEETVAVQPGYPCCSFRASMMAVDLSSGAVLWKTYTVPTGYSGGAIWGSSPAVDTKRKQVYVATGNNYSVPQATLYCVAAAGSDVAAIKRCIPADNLVDAIVALDLKTGKLKWSTAALPYDAWTVSCIPFLGDGSNCPQPAGPDYDFGQAPALFSVKGLGKQTELVGAGQKSGQYWALDPDTGAVKWVTQAGPGGTGGGLQWGSAVDDKRIYTANSNSNFKPTTVRGNTVNTGVWSALDKATGAVIWQQTTPSGRTGGLLGSTSGPVTTANGVVFGCSLDVLGYMYALDAATGAILWEYASGGSCLSGAAISNGEVYWGSGYTNFGAGTFNNKLYAFEIK